jgi:hypothetical protein
MKQRRGRFLTVAAVVALSGLILVGCGGGGETATDSTDSAQAKIERAEAAAAAEESEAETVSECDPNYSGECLDPYASDYDCAGGSGDGPEYTGPVTVVGSDHYGLDSDGDGYACEY